MEKQLPKNWVETDIESVAEILDNLRKPVSSNERSKRLGEVPYYGATGQAGSINDFIFNEELVLLGEDGAPFFDKFKNVAYIINGKSWVNNHAHVLKGKKVLSNKFLLHFFNQFDYTDYVGGTTRLKLNQGSLKSIPFPLPPLAEQHRIVAKLDMLFTQLETIKRSMANIPLLIKDFRKQVLTQAVTGKLTEEWRKDKELWEWRTELAQDCCEKVQSGGTPKGSNFDTSGIPFLKVYNIVNNKIDFEYNPQYVSESMQNSQIKKSITFPGDVVMNIVGPPLNKIAIIPEDYPEWNLNQAITLFRTKKYLSNKFLYYFFCEGSSVNSLINETKGVVGQVNISLSQCRNFIIPIPAPEEQQEIVSRVESLFAKADAIEHQYKALKASIDNLPQALLHKAFKGELSEQLDSDGDARELLQQIQELKNSAVKPKKATSKKVKKYPENETVLGMVAEPK
jgi:type I restriction enzyme S subunit